MALARLMSDLGAAQAPDGSDWSLGTEDVLWAIVCGERAPTWRGREVDSEQRAELWALAEATGGWIAWLNEPTPGPRHLDFARWQARYDPARGRGD